ncbi:hypothetical protein P2G88_07840 [Aliiglaciecola sp. CAU 1673]|uniref:hypothetical protein n=1 Tax=Aliiglaciecola sp. CAU 1673 TaxID=3032595 RepID=UPI0023DC71A5|nr:hypothetical protein [Aliiglaciecola sp. CAU 1673]MDF2178162.1 hypothetical protein [Aliiglaciecola sp. CAU 1673]
MRNTFIKALLSLVLMMSVQTTAQASLINLTLFNYAFDDGASFNASIIGQDSNADLALSLEELSEFSLDFQSPDGFHDFSMSLVDLGSFFLWLDGGLFGDNPEEGLEAINAPNAYLVAGLNMLGSPGVYVEWQQYVSQSAQATKVNYPAMAVNAPGTLALLIAGLLLALGLRNTLNLSNQPVPEPIWSNQG